MADKFKMVNDKLVKLSSEDISQLKKDEEALNKLEEDVKKEEETKLANKTSAITKLKKLGLTDEEITALVGE
tara:strand:- start:323 stop:538 length:216 start_codon:yes stop_codon:yes gene_type:complete